MRNIWCVNRDRVVGIVIIIIAILLGASYAYQVHSESTRASCQADLNQDFIDNITIRSELSNERQDAVDNLLTGVTAIILHPALSAADKTKQSAQALQLFSSYNAAVAANDASKAQHPLPSLTDRC